MEEGKRRWEKDGKDMTERGKGNIREGMKREGREGEQREGRHRLSDTSAQPWRELRHRRTQVTNTSLPPVLDSVAGQSGRGYLLEILSPLPQAIRQ